MDEIERREKLRIERGIKRRKKWWEKDPERLERGKIAAMRAMGEEMEPEYPLQAKVSVVDLANIALGFYNRGDHGALRSLSALGQAAIAVAAIQLVEWENLEEITDINEAINLLEELRLIDRNVKALNRGAILRNKIRENSRNDPAMGVLMKDRGEQIRSRRTSKSGAVKEVHSPEEAEKIRLAAALKRMRDMGMPTVLQMGEEWVEILFDEEGEPIIPQKKEEMPSKPSVDEVNRVHEYPGLHPPQKIHEALVDGTYKPGMMDLKPHMDATWSQEKKLEVFKERSEEKLEKE